MHSTHPKKPWTVLPSHRK